MKFAGSSRNSGFDARCAAFSCPLPPAVTVQYNGGPLLTRSRISATTSEGYSGVCVRTCWKSSTPAINPCRISASLNAWAATLRPRACASSTIAFISSGVNASALMTLIQSTPASINWLVFVLRIGRTGDIPRLNGVRVPSFRERRTGDVHRRPGDFSARDALPDGKDWLRRRREIADGRHAGHQHLLRRRGHDDPLELRRVGVEPIPHVRMTRVHQMHVEIPQPGEHGESFRGHGLVAVRHRQRNGRSDLLDAFAADQDDAVTKRRAACAVDQRAANQRERPAL